MSPTLCLNMIVKNESRIIRRLLDSVVGLVDAYCICDTGSTDNTIELIREYFEEREIPGKIVEEPFRDFGYNRSVALQACNSMEDVDYILLLDADMVLEGELLNRVADLKRQLKLDYYYVFQGNSTYYYKNVRIVKNNRGFSYWGVTHEYVNAPTGAVVGTFERDQLFISDIGDGGAKGDKTERDIRLLEKGLLDLPNNDRYTYYLANSYRDAGKQLDAIEMYKTRIQIGGWIEEIWQSYYNIGNCYMSLGGEENEGKAIVAWMEGYNAYPRRIENIYKIVEYYRTRSKYMLAYSFYCIADDSRKKWTNWSDYLFLERDVYDYKIDYEASIIAYYIRDHLRQDETGIDYCMRVFNDKHSGGVYNNTMCNYKFYVDNLVEKHANTLNTHQQKLLNSIGDCINIPDDFVRSTPSVCLQDENTLIVNVRYVNYRIDGAGNYVNKDHITTMNVIGCVNISDAGWKLTEEFLLEYDRKEDGRYVGLEDIRLFCAADGLLYNANRGLASSGNMTVEYGKIDVNNQICCQSKWLKHGNSTLEKNWVLCPGRTEPWMIYGWSPLVIGTIDDASNFCEKMRKETPPCFRDVRGSTNGIVVGDEIWFVVHSVSYEDRRHYYHMIIALDRETCSVKRYSPFFTFEGKKVEFTLGIVFLEKEKQILMGYSTMDCECKFVQYELDSMDRMLVYKP